jgi:hypothetical protein
LFGGLAAIVLAFLLTSTTLYWLAIFAPQTGWHYVGSTYIPGYSSTYIPGYSSTYIHGYENTFTPNANALRTLSPADERLLLDDIYAELKQESVARLYQMRAFNDVCVVGLADCRGLPHTTVKPFIDAIISDRTSSETGLFYQRAVIVASFSMMIAFIALIFNALTYFIARRASSNRPLSSSK